MTIWHKVSLQRRKDKAVVLKKSLLYDTLIGPSLILPGQIRVESHTHMHKVKPINLASPINIKDIKLNWRAVTLSFKLNIVTWQLRYKVTRVKEKNKKRFNSTLYKSTLKGLYRCIKELLDQKPGRATASSEIEAFNGKRTPFQHSIQLYVVPVHPPAWTLTYHLVFQ